MKVDTSQAIEKAIGRLLHRERIDPQHIIRRIVRQARAQARKWGSDYKVDVPNEYVVRVNERDWSSYFEPLGTDIEDKMSEIVSTQLTKMRYLYIPPIMIRIASDMSLEAGSFEIDAGFGPRNEANKGESWKGRRPPFQSTPDIAAPDAEERANETLSIYDATVIQRRSDETGFLVFAEGALVAVHPGDTIGVIRRSGDVPPDIILDDDRFKYYSQIQGVFGKNGDGWFFQNIERNSPAVVSGSLEQKLDGDSRAALRGGSIIRMAFCEDIEFRLTAVNAE